MIKNIINTLICLTLFGFIGFSQVVEVTNKSFEGFPKRGNETSPFKLDGWVDCGRSNFGPVTPPDIHPQNYWKVNLLPSHGQTYVGLVVRPDMTYESISQKLKDSLQANTCYAFSLDCVKSDSYKSPVVKFDTTAYNFTVPVVIRIFGSKTPCYLREGSKMPETELLAISPPITNTNVWQSYVFTISPQKTHKYITIEAFFSQDADEPYKGHVCIDNASDFLPIGCNDDNAIVSSFIERDNLELKPIQTQKKVSDDVKVKKDIPKKVEKEVVIVPKKEVIVPTIKEEKKETEKILSGLDKNIKAGEKIRIENLFFEVDSVCVPESSFEVLDEVYTFLRTNNQISIEIGGHTNGLPPHEYCDKLSTKRAKEVATYLIKKGITASRIKYKGYGKRQPLASNKTASGRAKNQRVELKILAINEK